MKFSRGVRAVAVVVASLIVSLLVVKLVPLLLLDGAIGLPLAPFTDTEYAPRYSHLRFMKLRIGMTRAEVIDLVGEPLSRDQNGSLEFWRYSRSPGDTHYRVRVVLFDPAGRVFKIASEFYVD
jgi:hypothetical protein